MRLRAPKDFWIGLVYLGVGTATLLLSRDYAVGDRVQLGPGAFPVLLAALLILLGLVSTLRAFVRQGGAIRGADFKALVLVCGSVAAFGFLLPRLGLVGALAALTAIAGAASARNRPDRRSLLLAALVITAFLLVFVRGLNLQIPVVGSWLH